MVGIIRSFSIVFIISFIIIGGVFCLPFMINNKTCDELVIMNDGSQIEATDVTSYENGMSTIKMCDDTQMRTPTINIKFIKHINNEKK